MILSGVFQLGLLNGILNWWDKKMKNEDTLEIYKLIIDRDEVEYEATDTVSEYLIQRAALFGNQLGRQKKKIKDFDVVEDALSGGWVLVCYCERCIF